MFFFYNALALSTHFLYPGYKQRQNNKFSIEGYWRKNKKNEPPFFKSKLIPSNPRVGPTWHKINNDKIENQQVLCVIEQHMTKQNRGDKIKICM